MKKFIAMLLTMMLLVSGVSVFADSWEYEITVTYNGEPVSFAVEPQIINDRTMVPFRAIFETIGGTVDFDGETRTVSSVKDGKKLSFVIGEYEAVLESEEGKEIIPIDSAPVIVDDYTLVPVRFVAEGSGLKVNWIEEYREVVIIDTERWKEEITAKSPFFDMVMNMPLNGVQPEKAYEVNEEFNINLSLSLKNMGEVYPEGTEGPENIDLSLSLKLAGDEYYDGESALSKASIALDLSTIGDFIKELDTEATKESLEGIDSIFRPYDIDVEVIIDKDNNVYFKSEDLVSLIDELGGTDIASLIGDKYIKVAYPEELSKAMEAETLWAFVDEMIEADDTLTSADVQMLQYVWTAVADICSEENIKFEEKEDGGYKILIDVTKEDYISAMTSMFDAMWDYEGIENLPETEVEFVEEQKKAALEVLNIFDFSLKGEIDVTDEVNQTEDVSGYFAIDELPISDSGNATVSFKMEITGKAAAKEAEGKDKIEIPEDAIDILEQITAAAEAAAAATEAPAEETLAE